MSPVPMDDAAHEERMANWKRGYDAGVIAGRREVQEAIRQALGLDDRYEMLQPAD